MPRASAEPIQRHREVVHPDLRHDDLLTSYSTATGAGCRGPPPVRTIHWPKVIASAWPLSIIIGIMATFGWEKALGDACELLCWEKRPPTRQPASTSVPG